MSQQTYPVACECGKEHQVTGGQAGSSFPCGCGKVVEVPTLGALKRSVGQSAVSAELEIEHRLADGSLPEERNCVLCGARTPDTLMVSVECERSEVKSNFKWWYWLLFPFLLFKLIVIFAYATRRVERHGRDVSFRLPVRVCKPCQPQMRTAADARDALFQSELYARLLAKYPHAVVSPPT